ncbi:hypothetical protein C8Q80DRAFT_75694 [Daedaleopsis nitida]|nr:hypothetical protein C8Q80DRAFT_75694 [Daedaleopsis nitida]
MIDPRHDQTSPTERTPLLPGSSRPPRYASPHPTNNLPHIGSFVAEMRPEDLHKYSIDNLYLPTLHPRSAQISFALCILLYYRAYLGEEPPRERDVWVRWRQEQQNTVALKEVDALLEQVWTSFLREEGSPTDVQEVIWTAYPLYPDSRRTIRVLDFLSNGDTPEWMRAHSLVQLTLTDAWTYGLDRGRDDDNYWLRLLHFMDYTGTPHVLHILDLSFWMIYLACLGNYLMDPPLQTELSTSDNRVALIALYSLSRLLRPWSSTALPFGLSFLAFVLTFPSVPLPDTSAYTALLLAFSWQVILLHLPVHPSPLFLLAPDQILPLAVLVWRGLARTFIPVIAFFIPGLLISLSLLSISLSDKFLHLTTTSTFTASPIESRVIFLSLFAIIFIFLCCALGFSVLVHPFLAPAEDSPPMLWDRYSKLVGKEARQTFARVTAAYAIPYYFPAPLNLLQLLLVQAPRRVAALFHWKAGMKPIGAVERVLWRISVAPFTFIIAAFWLWHLPGRW